MIAKQETLNLSPYLELYDLIIPKDNMLRQINELVDFSFSPLNENCYKKGAQTKTYNVTIKSIEHLDQEEFQNTVEFKKLAKNRYKIEAKNSELKNGHGYHTANSTGILGMEIQGATTIFAVNLKRIMKLLNKKVEE